MAYVDIHKIVNSYGNLSRTHLVLLAAKLSRIKGITPVAALRLIENHEVDIDKIDQSIIEDHQTIQKPEQDEHES